MKTRWCPPAVHLGAVEGLDLALLVDREDDRMGGGIEVEANNVFELLGERRVVREFECPDAVRGELMGLENALHRPQAHSSGLRQHPAGPVGGFPRRHPKRQIATRCTVATGSGFLPGLRVLSRISPATPSAMNRAC